MTDSNYQMKLWPEQNEHRFIFLDTETTGIEKEDRLCQIAFKAGDYIVNELFKPPDNRKISLDAMSVHHITNEMVDDKELFKESGTRKELIKLLEDNDSIMVAHNAEFDIEMLKKEEVYPGKFICTLKLARYLDREGILEKYNLQYLRYYYNISINANAHDAFGDILVLEAIFEKYYKEMVGEYGYNAINKMIEISKNPIQIKRMPFGKYKGKKIEEIPKDYLSWLSSTDIDSDMRYTVEQQLRKFQNHRD